MRNVTRLENSVSVEAGIDDRALAALGHNVIPGSGFGGGQIIVIDPEGGALLGGSDPRKDGCAIGY